MNLLKAFRAGFVRRWHTNPDLAHTNDRIDAHSGRVARIIALLHPNPSADLLVAALNHDDGEFAVGDMKAPLKDERPDIAMALAEIETFARATIWGADPAMSDLDRQWLKFADRLDAYMWAKHHAPHALRGDGWPDAVGWLLREAYELGCHYMLDEIISTDAACCGSD